MSSTACFLLILPRLGQIPDDMMKPWTGGKDNIGGKMWRGLSLVVIKDNTQISDWGITWGFRPLLFVVVLGSIWIHLGMRPGRTVIIKGRRWLY